MSPGRHEAGSGPPEDVPWARTSDRHVGRAYRNGCVLTVSRRAHEAWIATVEEDGVITGRAPSPLPTRRAAQAWCDRKAGERQAGS